ncbi:uncharacterized protein TNCV_1104161 [Trichonephila clavipes]|nr:uncharacterized protein TNCV_1104161 [Trichonephila clavipes]
MATGSYLTQNHSRSQSEIQGDLHTFTFRITLLSTVVKWYGYQIVAGFVTGLRPVPLKTRRVGQRCTLNLSRAETSSRWCGAVLRRGGVSSGVVHVT